MELIFTRPGSAIQFSESGKRSVSRGDVAVLGANTLCGCEPEAISPLRRSMSTRTETWYAAFAPWRRCASSVGRRRTYECGPISATGSGSSWLVQDDTAPHKPPTRTEQAALYCERKALRVEDATRGQKASLFTAGGQSAVRQPVPTPRTDWRTSEPSASCAPRQESNLLPRD